MIVYDLKCEHGHAFEGWFDNLQAFEDQSGQGLIACPVCGSTEINRTPSTFGIARHREQGAPEHVGHVPGNPAPDPAKLFQQFIESNFENVGTEFAKEALKMHYGVSENRSIRGVSTEQEEEMLRQEGIDFFKFPDLSRPLPDDED